MTAAENLSSQTLRERSWSWEMTWNFCDLDNWAANDDLPDPGNPTSSNSFEKKK